MLGNDDLLDDFDEDSISISPSDLSTRHDYQVSRLIIKQSHESIPGVNSYQIKPSLNEKFKETPVKEIIRNVTTSILTGKHYEPESVKKWTITIANEINEKVKELEMKRYKHIVQVVLGEMKGAGVKSGLKCLWDSESDGFTSDVFMSDHIFCLTTVFAIYLY